jgi:cytochrome c-type biogenesis protein CcmH
MPNFIVKSTIFIIILAIILPIKLLAIAPEEHLKDDLQEERAVKLFLKIRCLTCQGQLIESSDSDFALQIRNLVREQISEGFNDEQIINNLIAEFGESIISDNIMHNKIIAKNLIIWLLPLIFSIILLYYGISNLKSRK